MADFASVDDLATLLRRDLTVAESAAAALLIKMATAEIKLATRQEIELVTDDQVALHGTWDRYLTLPQWPVVSVSAVSVNSFPVVTGTWLLASDRLYRGNLPIFNGPDEWGGDLWVTSWLGPAATVEVTYTHGFADIPLDVKSACLRAVMRAFENPSNLTGETVGAYSYQQAEGEVGGLLTQAERDALVLKYSKEI